MKSMLWKHLRGLKKSYSEVGRCADHEKDLVLSSQVCASSEHRGQTGEHKDRKGHKLRMLSCTLLYRLDVQVNSSS
jgi:hypothetical protein